MKSQTIGQLAKRAGIRPSTLRYYEEQDLLKPSTRSAAGYRLYNAEDEQILHFIQRAQRLGFSLADIRILLNGQRTGNLSHEAIVETAKARYLALEQQVTHLLILRHEMGLFLQDMHHQTTKQAAEPTTAAFDSLLSRVCANPLNQPARAMLNWLIEYTGCLLNSEASQQILNDLRGQHVHVWQEGEDYYILVVSDDPTVEAALQSLVQLETNCQIQAHNPRIPELAPNDEGFLFIARGSHAFIFARLFLSLEEEVS